jgi:hypothetical protein
MCHGTGCCGEGKRTHIWVSHAVCKSATELEFLCGCGAPPLRESFPSLLCHAGHETDRLRSPWGYSDCIDAVLRAKDSTLARKEGADDL